MTDFRAIKLQDLQDRWQRIHDMVRQQQERFDSETRIEERQRIELLIQGKKRDLEGIEAEISKLKSDGSNPSAPASPPPAPPQPASPQPPPSATKARTGPRRLFYSYAHEDEAYRKELAKHLKLLERGGVLSSWHDRDIRAGDELDQEISQNLLDADIILLLVSVDFMASDYIWSKELTVALERHDKGEARVIPIILRPTDWAHAPFRRLKALPKDGRPVSEWPSKDEAFVDIAIELRKVLTSP